MIQYPAFRTWQTMQKRSNNSIVALSIGAEHVQQEMARSGHPIVRAGALLAAVPQADRLDVTATEAEQIFKSAATDMAFLAIPHVMAVHIELCVGTVIECQRFPGLIKPHKDTPDWWNVPLLHKTLRFGEAKSTADHLLEFCLKLRNRMMHGAGTVDEPLVKLWDQLPPAAKTRWEGLTGRPFTYTRVGALPTLDWPEIMATLAVTKESAYEINARIERLLTREQWAQVIARDYRDASRTGRRRFNSVAAGQAASSPVRDRVLQRLQGHALTYYRQLAMTAAELNAGRDAVR